MKITHIFYRLALSLILFSGVYSEVSADTFVSGSISADTTWTCAGSPYILTGNVMVQQGLTLTIEPCVVVKLDPDKSILVDGTLIARGTNASKITFTANGGPWGYIHFSDTSADAVYDANGNFTGGSVLEHVVVEQGGGLNVSNNGALRMEKAHPFINYCAVRNNKASGIYAWDLTSQLKVTNSVISGNNGRGLYVFGGTAAVSNSDISNNMDGGIYAYYGTVIVSGNTISNNITANDGGGIFVGFGISAISNNTISNNAATNYSKGGGIYIYYGTSNISGNTIEDNSEGIYSWSSKVTIFNNIIRNNNGTGINAEWFSTADILKNIVRDHAGRGISTSNSAAAISHNIILNNRDGGINEGNDISNNIISNNSTSGEGGGIKNSKGRIINNSILFNTALKAPAVLSDYSNYDFMNNTITGNNTTGLYAIHLGARPRFSSNNIFNNSATYTLWNGNNEGAGSVSASGNWWGTASASVIAGEIYDWFDDATRSVVNYSPFAAAILNDPPVSPPAGLTVTSWKRPFTLSWNANPESDIAGYNVAYWDADSNYYSVDAGPVTSYVLNTLPAGTYDLTITAYDNDISVVDDPDTVVNEKQTSGHESWYANMVTITDSDRDGYSADADCDDSNMYINPEATEACDGIDNDCDGIIDEGFNKTFYRDADNDDYGNLYDSVQSCTQPQGYVTDNTDCNDKSPKEYPGQLWYSDTDNDGYSDGATSISCARPAAYKLSSELTALSGDCDDTQASAYTGATEICDNLDNDCDSLTDENLTRTTTCGGVGACSWNTGTETCTAGVWGGNTCDPFKGAAPEVCNGIDDDCDGATDEGVIKTFYRDADGDNYGNANSVIQFCTQPFGYVPDNSDCDDSDPKEYPGQLWYIDSDNDGHSSGVASISCTRPAAYKLSSELTALSGDCDDTQASVYTGASEICDNLDNDCDALADEALTRTTTCGTGVCSGNTGFETCTAGAWGGNTCDPFEGAVPEVCNGLDDDCDGATDEGVIKLFYKDADKDGYGNLSDSVQSCTLPSGYVINNTDCNDADSVEHPGQAWYKDADNDGYSDGTSDTKSCTRPYGYKASRLEISTKGTLDCNDNDPNIYPGAKEGLYGDPTCSDGADNNCDGFIDSKDRKCYASDLLVTRVSNPPKSRKKGSSFKISSTTKNQGKKTSNRSSIRYYLSQDVLRDINDFPLRAHAVPRLLKGARFTKIIKITIPDDAVTGSYYLIACADNGDIVIESDEDNNCTASGGMIEVK